MKTFLSLTFALTASLAFAQAPNAPTPDKKGAPLRPTPLAPAQPPVGIRKPIGTIIRPPQLPQAVINTNSLLKVNESAFAGITDFKASVGVELRVQVPIVNVPFRLIYYYNPNAKLGYTAELPGIFLPGKRNGFRFTVGRTF